MTDLKPEDPACVALMERLEAWAAKERHNARHVRGPAFHPPWGQDIIDRHNQNADDLTLALSLLADRARMEKALREAERAILQEIDTRDTYESAVQDLDLATGGDGEFRVSNDPDRNTPDPVAMCKRIATRFARQALGASQ